MKFVKALDLCRREWAAFSDGHSAPEANVQAFLVRLAESFSEATRATDLADQLPAGLHEESKRLVGTFAGAMADKLYQAQVKGRAGWRDARCVPALRADLIEHVYKGDPRDVANYCAFLWFHGAPTWISTQGAMNHE